MTLISMSIEEVHDYMEKNNIEVFESFTEDDDVYWGFTGKTGFSTFDTPMNEDKAKYASVLFYKLVKEHGICFPDAEYLAQAFVAKYKVMNH